MQLEQLRMLLDNFLRPNPQEGGRLPTKNTSHSSHSLTHIPVLGPQALKDPATLTSDPGWGPNQCPQQGLRAITVSPLLHRDFRPSHTHVLHVSQRDAKGGEAHQSRVRTQPFV